jgi:hypothetical protein
MRQVVDVQAASGDVGGDEDVHLAALEVVKRAHALRLALVAVDGGRGDAVLLELHGEAAGTVLRAREDQRLLDRPEWISSLSTSRLRPLSTPMTTWRTSSEAVFLGVTWTKAGWCRKSAASFFTCVEKVAENISV